METAEGVRFRSLVEILPDPVFVFAPVRVGDEIVDLRYTHLNQACSKLMGRDPREVEGHRLLEIFPTAKEAGIYSFYVGSLESGEPDCLRVPWFEDGGVAGSFDLSTAVLGDELVVVAREITDALAVEERRRAMLESLLDPHVLLQPLRGMDGDGQIVDFMCLEANAAAREYLRDQCEELVGSRLLNLPIGRSVLGLCAQALASGEPLVLDDHTFAPEELPDARRFDIRAIQINNDLSLVWRDVTDRYLQQEALAESEARYRLVAENANDIVFQSSAESGIQWLSPSVTSVLGWTPEEMVGRQVSEFLHPEDLTKLADANDLFAQGKPGSYEARVRRRDGSYLWMAVTGRPILDEDGAVIGRVGSGKDVNEQVLALQALAVERDRLQATMDSQLDAHIILQALRGESGEITDFVVTDANHATYAYTALPPEQFVGSRMLDLWPAKAGAELLPQFAHVAETGDPLVLDEYRFELEEPDGVRYIDLRAVRVGDGVSYTWRNVTDRHRAAADLAEAERRYRLLAENATDAVFLADPNGSVVWVSPAVQRVLGWPPDALIGSEVADLVHHDDQPVYWSAVGAVSAGKSPVSTEFRARLADGDYRWMSAASSAFHDGDGDLVGQIVTLRDIEQQVRDREALARSERTFRLAMDMAPHAMAVVGLQGQILQTNQMLCDLLERDDGWLRAHRERDILHPDDIVTDQQVRGRLLAGEGEYNIHEARLVDAAGEAIWVQHALALVRDQQDLPLFYVSQYQDITEARRMRHELQHRAPHDPLTGLINRSGLNQRLEQQLGHAPRRAGVPALLYCDVDYFKTINDGHGHAVGDTVLVETARRIRAVLREEDEVARLGGDEFVVLLSEVTDLESALEVARKIRLAVAAPIVIDHETVTVTLSIGVALAEPDIEPHRLLRNADRALYRAKNLGRDALVAFGSE